MKKLKKIGWVLLIVMLLVSLAAFVAVQLLKPDYDEELRLPKLSKNVKVYYDNYGIPHIYASNDEDAYRALGYVHAQDRLWQMELLRRVAIGGLSEIFGQDLVNTDRFFLSLGIDEATATTVSGLNTSVPYVKLSQAYLDGVNQFIAEGPTPIEFYLTGLEKTPYTLHDIYNAVGYMAFSFAMAHKTDPLLTDIQNQLPAEYLQEILQDDKLPTLRIKNHNLTGQQTEASKMIGLVSKALKGLPIPQFEGSNSWVLAPGKTKNGKVILANDPHIGFAQPAVWYEAHLSTPSYEKYGYHLAGVPFPLLGHNRQLAYGLTMFENDDIDFYYEEGHPTDSTQYKTAGGWASYEYITKTIKVKDAADINFVYKKSEHGSILNGIANQIKGERPISMSWIYTRLENKVMDALYGISTATNLEEFSSALPKIHAPGLNVMYGDASGNIAWWAAATLYKMPDSVNTKLVLDGSAGKNELEGYLAFSENPQAINPPWNYVYSANNQPDSIAGMLYPGYYLPENRAKRIEQLLSPKDDWDMGSVGEMMLDGTSSVNPAIVTNLRKALNINELSAGQIKALDLLSSWDGSTALKSVAPTIFHRWIYYFLRNTFADEMGTELFKQFLSTHLHKRILAPMAAKEESVWWDDTATKEVVETRNTIVQNSFIEAIESLETVYGNDPLTWSWDRVHTLEHTHPIGQIAALRSFFNVGPYPVSGTREVINNMYFSYDSTGVYNVSSGPSTRRVIDFSDIENSMSILPTGQSGNPFSPHYNDQAQRYIKGEFRKMMLNKDEIENTSKSLLIFRRD